MGGVGLRYWGLGLRVRVWSLSIKDGSVWREGGRVLHHGGSKGYEVGQGVWVLTVYSWLGMVTLRGVEVVGVAG